MAKMRDVGSAFLDGLGSLSFLFERPVRPGSDEDLIESLSVSEERLLSRVTSQQDLNTSVVAQLRAVADKLEAQKVAPDAGLSDDVQSSLRDVRRSLVRLRAERLKAARADRPAADSLHAL
jgi:hypothetical protein